MTPPVLPELLSDLEEFFQEHLWLMEADPDEYLYRLRHFTTYVACRAYRSGCRAVLTRASEPSEN